MAQLPYPRTEGELLKWGQQLITVLRSVLHSEDQLERNTICTFAELPAAAKVGPGVKGYQITDCNTAVFNAVAAAGGANEVPVHTDSTPVWRVG